MAIKSHALSPVRLYLADRFSRRVVRYVARADYETGGAMRIRSGVQFGQLEL